MSRFITTYRDEGVGYIENALIKSFDYIYAGGIGQASIQLEASIGREQISMTFGEYADEKGARVDTIGFTYEFINSILTLTDSTKTSQLPGKIIRIARGINAWDDNVALGHVIKNKWFYTQEVVSTLRSEYEQRKVHTS